ncbi:MAG: hypothetical protein WAO71_12560 [Gallionella sp.]
MASPTATEMRDKYLAAELALLEGKEVSFGDRKLKMEDLPNIIAGRKEIRGRERLSPPPNRACDFASFRLTAKYLLTPLPAHGSPMSGFRIGVSSPAFRFQFR